ncbi:39S ribosomal protein L41, mitochondrial [Habropoda laboriosa]|uniref:39S ribosomal protein L41, mitochondrial n=1 Tax=Habropoda laboriosa TaxID=597456 RepID=A0A0L7QT18_9HYME|nr:PREDICTED: 39S ribosomal protein L41, mitochondrial [Habropoda laboriosa]KOC61699.1 39S ribosomal protein L41, mitochondrial [Habropoda laboriosa]
MASKCLIIYRQISTSTVFRGKRNFRMIQLYNKRGSRQFKEERAKNLHCDIPIDRRGLKLTGKWENDKWVNIPEMIPELIVPDLKDFHLKPYVSYRVPQFTKREFTAKDLFYLTYADKIKEDYKNCQLDENGQPLNPSENEKMTAEEAKNRADQTGTDLFQAKVV